MENYVDLYTRLYSPASTALFRKMEGVTGNQFCDQTCPGVRLTAADRLTTGECKLMFYTPGAISHGKKTDAAKAWIRLNLSWRRRKWQTDDFGDVSESDFAFLASYLDGGRPDCPDLSAKWVGRERDPVLAEVWNSWIQERFKAWNLGGFMTRSVEKIGECVAEVDSRFMKLIRGLDPAEDFECLPISFIQIGPIQCEKKCGQAMREGSAFPEISRLCQSELRVISERTT